MNGSVEAPELLSKLGLRVPCEILRRFDLLHAPVAKCSYRQKSYLIRASRAYKAASQKVDNDNNYTSVAKFLN